MWCKMPEYKALLLDRNSATFICGLNLLLQPSLIYLNGEELQYQKRPTPHGHFIRDNPLVGHWTSFWPSEPQQFVVPLVPPSVEILLQEYWRRIASHGCRNLDEDADMLWTARSTLSHRWSPGLRSGGLWRPGNQGKLTVLFLERIHD